MEVYGVWNSFPQSFCSLACFIVRKQGVWLLYYGLFHYIWGMVNINLWKFRMLLDGKYKFCKFRMLLGTTNATVNIFKTRKEMGISDDVSTSYLCTCVFRSLDRLKWNKPCLNTKWKPLLLAETVFFKDSACLRNSQIQ